MSESELRNHRDGPQVLVGIKGHVFDVTGKEVYMEGGSYRAFAGRDASVALAKMNFADDLMDPSKHHWSTSLNQDEMKILDDWVKFYKDRYPVVAMLEEQVSRKD